MKTLYLLRHAQAANDLQRDVSAKGVKQAGSIGHWMSKNGVMPDWIISSSIKRSKVTAKIVSGQINYTKSIRFEDGIQDAGDDTYLDIIATLNDKYDSIMIVGHNPAISAVVWRLTGVQLDMSACMLVCIEIPIDEWTSVRDANATLKWFQIPS